MPNVVIEIAFVMNDRSPAGDPSAPIPDLDDDAHRISILSNSRRPDITQKTTACVGMFSNIIPCSMHMARSLTVFLFTSMSEAEGVKPLDDSLH